ncbi:serine/threonine-protein kinase [uncultured Aquimonas sp.]|uniref:serine/threonine-protein kinase n=1 Tax=uncultured Aquimonas sp. TaxID=385483 RepID=UPI00086DB8A6|nr:serine/threonine-protein kinase [uncultured Aquimonas sp.]ODU42095.1 MAG: hypothetical protein ABS96_29170 [Xanthomonadaceae bacterium SCN 69-123]
MSDTPFNALAEAFDRIVALPVEARADALAALPEGLREEVRRLLLADTQPDDPLQAVLEDLGDALQRARAPGARLGPWRVLRELGAGGMGTVLLAERAEAPFEQRAAIKLIRGFPTEDSRRRLRQERRILAQLDHPCIARLLDGGETADGQPWVALEYVEGLGLMAHITQSAPTLAQRLALFDRIAQAVAHAHQQLVIHRDLKPGNVLVRADGEPKLLDFGVAKLIELGDDSARRETSTRVWTEGYASPEQREGRAVTTASDVYALGVMLRDLLEGDAGARQHGGFPALPIDAELRGVIAMACADVPSQRYPTVEALRDELTRYQEGRPLRAAADTGLYRLRKFLQRHRLPVGLGALAVLLLAGNVVWLQHERAEAVAARLAAEHANATRGLQYRFLAGVLQGAAGRREDGSPLLATDLLDRMRDRLETEAAGDPLARTELESLLASAYLNAGRWADAKPLFIASAEHGEQLKDASDTAYSLREAARMAIELGEFAEAGRLLDRAQALLGEAPYDAGAANAAIRIGLTRIELFKRTQDPRLDAQIERTAQQARAWLPESHFLRALVLGEQAARMENRGEYAQLATLRREVLAVAQATPNVYPGDVRAQRFNLARALEFTGDLDGAEAELALLESELARTVAGIRQSEHVQLRMRRASLALARCLPAQARSLLDEARTLAGQLDLQASPADLLLAARIALALGESERAQTLFSETLAMPISPEFRSRVEVARHAAPGGCPPAP